MAQVREIKCPHCGEWTMWKGHVDDRCFFCDGFIEPQRFSREIEQKINKLLILENDYFFIKPGDGEFKRFAKTTLNGLRWGVFYIQLIIFAFVTVFLVLLSVLAV